MKNKFNLLIITAWFLASVAGFTASASGQTPPRAAQEGADTFDCVIEPRMSIKLGSPDSGIVDNVKVDRGAIVRKGEIVATLDARLQQLIADTARLKAENDLDIRAEQARLEYRTAEARRNEALHGSNFVSTKSYEEAMAEKKLAEFSVGKAEFEHRMAQQDLAQALARLDRRSVRSPIDGIVTDVPIRPGEYATEQTVIMTIAEIDPLYVKVFVPVRHYRRILAGSNADVYPEQPIGGMYQARVTVVDRVFDPASSTFGVRLELPNHDASLPAGMRCRVRFPSWQAAQ